MHPLRRWALARLYRLRGLYYRLPLCRWSRRLT
jgi:hypothetical protein